MHACCERMCLCEPTLLFDAFYFLVAGFLFRWKERLNLIHFLVFRSDTQSHCIGSFCLTWIIELHLMHAHLFMGVHFTVF